MWEELIKKTIKIQEDAILIGDTSEREESDVQDHWIREQQDETHTQGGPGHEY